MYLLFLRSACTFHHIFLIDLQLDPFNFYNNIESIHNDQIYHIHNIYFHFYYLTIFLDPYLVVCLYLLILLDDVDFDFHLYHDVESH